jgi:hypothetical protein
MGLLREYRATKAIEDILKKRVFAKRVREARLQSNMMSNDKVNGDDLLFAEFGAQLVPYEDAKKIIPNTRSIISPNRTKKTRAAG